MGKSWGDMSEEERRSHYQATEKYRKSNADKYRSASMRYYHNNKEKCRIKNAEWRARNKALILERNRENKRKRKAEVVQHFGGCCNDCGGVFPDYVYNIHHKDPNLKTADPSKMMSLSRERLYKELENCVLLCANCHLVRHHEEDYEQRRKI